MIFQYSGEITDRYDFSSLVPVNGTVAEIGVHRGIFAERFLSDWIGTYWMIDNWERYSEMPDRDREVDFEFVCDKFSGRAVICRQTSETAAKILPNDLDFVYIDASHEYHDVSNDIRWWWPKVKRGGILAGHDLFSNSLIGVTNAVIEFAQRENVVVDTVPPTKNKFALLISAASWYVRKE